MRARNLKPSFFTNEVLVTLPPLARILFEGLWCVADCEGRLEDRPQRLKIQLLPCDDVDVDEMLNLLHRHEFINRYSVGGERYIHVLNFVKHQNPHKKERDKGSTIPAPENPGSDRENPDPARLLPSSLFPLPDSGILNPDKSFSSEKLARSDAGASSAPAGDEAEPGSDQPQKSAAMPKAFKGEQSEHYHQRYMAWARGEIARFKNAKREELSLAYPGVDIDRECVKAAIWLDAKPQNRKKSIPGFMARWLSRTQERGGNSSRGSPPMSRAEQKQAATVNAVRKILEDIGDDDE